MPHASLELMTSCLSITLKSKLLGYRDFFPGLCTPLEMSFGDKHSIAFAFTSTTAAQAWPTKNVS